MTGTTADTVGHGTHVAGTIAGSTYGVAKAATVIAVKVFAGDEGTTADVLDGFDCEYHQNIYIWHPAISLYKRNLMSDRGCQRHCIEGSSDSLSYQHESW